MSRPTDWSAVDFASDPIPGDPLQVSAVAAHYRETAEAITVAVGNLRRLDGEALVSQGFQTSFERIREVADKLDQAESRIAGTATALEGYWPHLESAQVESVKALQTAEHEAHQKRNTDSAAASVARQYNASNDPDVRNRLRAEYNRLCATSNEHSVQVYEARQRILDAIRERDEAARTAISQLDEVDQSSPIKDNVWDKAVDWYEKNVQPVLKQVAHAIAEFTEKWGLLIDVIEAVLTVIVSIICPPAGVILGLVFSAASILLSYVSIIDATFRFQDGEINVKEYNAVLLTQGISIGLSALAMIPGLKLLSAGGQVAKPGAKSLVKALGSVAIKGAQQGVKTSALRTITKEVAKGVGGLAKDRVESAVEGAYVTGQAASGERERVESQEQMEKRMREVRQGYQTGLYTVQHGAPVTTHRKPTWKDGE